MDNKWKNKLMAYFFVESKFFNIENHSNNVYHQAGNCYSTPG